MARSIGEGGRLGDGPPEERGEQVRSRKVAQTTLMNTALIQCELTVALFVSAVCAVASRCWSVRRWTYACRR